MEAVGPSVRLGRDPGCELALDPVAFAMVSGTHAHIEPGKAGFVLTHLSQSNKTLLNDRAITDSVRVNVGDRIRLGFTGPILTVVSLEATQDEAPPRAVSIRRSRWIPATWRCCVAHRVRNELASARAA